MALMASTSSQRPRAHHRSRAISMLATSLLGILLASPMSAQDSKEKVDVDEVSRDYVVHLPTGYDQKQHYPVVILLHGRNQDADDMARLRRISRLVALGVNLAGIGRILELEDDNAALLAENRAHGEKATRKTKPS